MPFPPTAKTFVLEVPQTARRLWVVPLAIAVQDVPSYRTIVPFPPTAKMSERDAPQIPEKAWVVPLAIGLQVVPL